VLASGDDQGLRLARRNGFRYNARVKPRRLGTGDSCLPRLAILPFCYNLRTLLRIAERRCRGILFRTLLSRPRCVYKTCKGSSAVVLDFSHALPRQAAYYVYTLNGVGVG
jgi:hypothetical protein